MRIEELWLDAYGPFTGVRFPLVPDRLNVIYGPNEAGKSTSLRAIEALLFEHEEKSRDAHVHEMSKLRVGGRVTTKAGAELSFIRKKGRLRTLLDPMSGEPIDDAQLVSMLGGIGREAFRAVYGLDHVRLAEGGKALAQGKGLVGESLFAASMGIVHLHRIQGALEEEGDAIYKLRGSRPLNAALEAVKKAREEADLGVTSAETVAGERAALEKRIRDEDELRERKRARELERNRLVRVRNVRPPIMELRSVLERLAERGEPHIVDPEAREDAERLLAISGPAVERLEIDLGAAKAARASVPIDMKVLAHKEEIRALWAERGAHVKAVHDRAGLEKELAELRRDLEALQGGPESELDLAVVDSAIKRAKGADVREEKLEAEEAEIRDFAESTEADLEALDLDGDIGAALRLAVPSEEAIDEAERTFEPHRTREEDLERAIAEREREIRELEDEIAGVRATSDTPAESDLAAARAKRDDVVEKGKTAEIVRAIAMADRIVDRMRADAEAVSKLALEQRRLEAAEKALARDRKALEDAKKHIAQLGKGWVKLWAAAKIEPASPTEMRAWHRRFSDARDACAEIEKRRRDAKTERAALEKVRAELERAGKPHRIGGETVGELLDRLREHHRKLEKSELGRTKEIESSKERIQRLEKRLGDMDREAETFRSRVATLVRSIDSTLAKSDDDPITTIHERWVAAEQDRKLADSSDARVKELEADLAKARTGITEAKSVLDRLLAASGADSIETLRRYEVEAREVMELRASRMRLESEIARLGDAHPIEELEAEAAQVGMEDARARIEELDRMIDQIASELENATRDVSGIRAGLKRYEEPLAQAAEATARAEQYLARARELALRHARLKLASGILARAIEHLRDKSQGPVIVRASAIFHRLTLGGFDKLSVALDDKDQPVLVGIRNDGREAGVSGMSDGTRDQLYLALRVASLERQAETGDPLPLVLDDVLMSFDDDRARAALGILAELARKMQVLLFTHHARTVELAREAVPDLALRELPSKAAVSAA